MANNGNHLHLTQSLESQNQERSHFTNGTMFLETTSKFQMNKANITGEKYGSFEIKSVVQSSRSAEDLDDSTDEDAVSEGPDSSINGLKLEFSSFPNDSHEILQQQNTSNRSLSSSELYPDTHHLVPSLESCELEQKHSLSQTPTLQNEQPQARFKVVKIGSTEPFKRGRWSCMDFLDPHHNVDIKNESPMDTNGGLDNRPYNFDAMNVVDIPSGQLLNISTTIASQIGSISQGASTIQMENLTSYQGSSISTISINTPMNSSNDSGIPDGGPCSSSDLYMSPAQTQTLTTCSSYSPSLSMSNILCEPSLLTPESAGEPNVKLDMSNFLGSGQVPFSTGYNFEALLEPLTMNMVGNNEEGEGASGGTSAVAIDNKIEQAMDLVKSHLMFAVREEVDVLKEKITELMEKINQLEYENGVLKAQATQETLSQLASRPPTSTTSSLQTTSIQQLQQQQTPTSSSSTSSL